MMFSKKHANGKDEEIQQLKDEAVSANDQLIKTSKEATVQAKKLYTIVTDPDFAINLSISMGGKIKNGH